VSADGKGLMSMRQAGLTGVRRANRRRTTFPGRAPARSPDPVGRTSAPAPNSLWLVELTDMPIADGEFLYTAFVIDAFAGLIAGWRVAGHQKNNISDSRSGRRLLPSLHETPGLHVSPASRCSRARRTPALRATTDKQR
jgi:transposase InsO family protein